jgi:DeoR-like helix-turn-helix domain
LVGEDGRIQGPLVAQRRRVIAERIRSQGAASVKDLACEFDVSPSTVRRDLIWLADRDHILRTWGGGVPLDVLNPKRATDIELAGREHENATEKAAVARAAASLVGDGDAIVIDALCALVLGAVAWMDIGDVNGKIQAPDSSFSAGSVGIGLALIAIAAALTLVGTLIPGSRLSSDIKP